jgi:hypothetical protein
MSMNLSTAQAVPARPAFQQTFTEARILAGFMDPNHFQMLTGDYLASIEPAERDRILREAEDARRIVAGWPQAVLGPVEVRPVKGPLVDELLADPLVREMYRSFTFDFQFVRADRVIALQSTVSPWHAAVPATEAELLAYCLPHQWEVPAEITCVQPGGPIQIVSSSPALRGLKVGLDETGGRVLITPTPHINLMVVQEYNGKYYMRNGYHRAFDLLAAGVLEIPMLVIRVVAEQLAEFGTQSPFNPKYVMGLARPPLLTDFASPAAVQAKVRARRYGLLVNLDIKPFTVNI